MPTLTAVRQRMLELEPRVLGQVYTPTSFTTTTAVVAKLATGTVGSGKYAGKFLLRATAANQPADRVRVVTPTGFNSATGAFTHAGTNYADTTVGSEQLEVLEFDPDLLDLAINEGIRRCRFIDTAHFQLRPDGRYPMTVWPWITEAQLVVRFGRRSSPVLTDNRHMERFGQVHTDGTLRPDSWNLGGSGATFARSTTTRRGAYALSVTRAGTDATVDQVIPVRYSDAPDDDLRGETVLGVAVARSTEASSVRVRVTSEDGSGNVLSTSNSSYHTGADAWEELSVEHVVHASAEQVRVSTRVEVNEAALLDEDYLAFGPEVTDALRRDDYVTEWLERPYDYTQNPLAWLGPRGRGQQLVVESRRPYPTFDATRLAAGTADGDTTDCPLDLAAHKALAMFFAGRATDNAKMASQATRYAELADQLQAGHMLEQTKVQPGAPVMSGIAYGRRAAVR